MEVLIINYAQVHAASRLTTSPFLIPSRGIPTQTYSSSTNQSASVSLTLTMVKQSYVPLFSPDL